MKIAIANPVNTTNAMGKKRKRPKNIHKSKKDEENILSKDIEDDNIRYMMDTKKNIKPREDLKSSFTLKNLRFKPQKYKGSFLPYHLRWIFNNNVKTNEIVLLNEIEGLENEINRLKILKLINRECRKIAGLPYGITTNFCQCCHLFEKKKHDCSHKYCNDNCPKKKVEELMSNLLKNSKLKEYKDNISKDKNIKKLFNETNNKNELLNQDFKNDIHSSLIKQSLTNNNNSNNSNITGDKIILDKNMNNNSSIDNNKNETNKKNLNPVKKRLIFGTVERSNKEKKSIFLVKSDSIMGNNDTFGIFGNNLNIKNNNENESNNNLSQEDEKNKDNYDVNNYTVSIGSDGDGDIEEVIDINNENDDEEKIDKDIDDKDKENDEDDVIIINQTSPHHSDNEN